jgi:hypothetical protein
MKEIYKFCGKRKAESAFHLVPDFMAFSPIHWATNRILPQARISCPHSAVIIIVARAVRQRIKTNQFA